MRSLPLALTLAALSANAQPTPLFDGQTLRGWSSVPPNTWRVEQNAITGGSLAGNAHNEFISTVQSYRNFDLKLEYKLTGTDGFINGGVQIRSRQARSPSYEMIGYQADIGAGYTGCLYDESRRRTVLAKADLALVRSLEKPGEWNQYEIRCELRRIRIYLNGTLTVDYLETDPMIDEDGVIGLQIHGKSKAIASYRNLVLEALPDPGVPITDQEYVLGPDSLPHAGVPHGTVSEYQLADSTAFPGFQRSWWLYLPANYDHRSPLPLMIFNDGGGFEKPDGTWRVPVVLDNLIAKREIPAMAALFVDPGDTPLAPGENPRVRPDGRSLAPKNRGLEYDRLGGRFASLIVDEMLPLVRQHLVLTDNPEGRGIAGSSSGGICAFTVAWERPDQFHKVLTAVGSFTGQGLRYPDLVRSTPPKPLRIFQQDGSHDQVIAAGSWPAANRALADALEARGYDHRFVFGHGSHNPRQAAALFPDALRWLWRDYPR